MRTVTTAIPHTNCAVSCTEYKCSHGFACSGGPACSGVLVEPRNLSTNYNAVAGFPANGQHANDVYGSTGSASAHADHVAPLQSTTVPPMSGAPSLNQTTPYHSALWPLQLCQCICLMPRPLAQQSSTQAEGAELARQRPILEAKVLEVEWRTRALNLNAVRGAEAHTQEQAPFK